MRTQKVTIRDVANAANVSTASVSRTLNKTGLVKETTQKAILEAVEKLGYIYEDKTAAAPQQSVSEKEQQMAADGVILVNIPSMSNPFYSKIIHGIQSSAASRNKSVIFSSESISDSNVNNFILLMKQLNVIGLILLNTIPPSSLKEITSHIPVVQCCEYYDNPFASYVGINDYISVQIAIDYFLSMGRKKIGFINGPLEFKYSQNRLAAFKDIMKENQIEVPSNWIVQLPELNHDIAFTSVIQVLSSPNPPDCFFAAADPLAAAVIKAAQYCNLKIPGDIMVIGFDNTDISQLSTPSITTIQQPRYQLGFFASELLFEKIEDPLSEIKQMKLNTELIIRESTTREVSNISNSLSSLPHSTL